MFKSAIAAGVLLASALITTVPANAGGSVSFEFGFNTPVQNSWGYDRPYWGQQRHHDRRWQQLSPRQVYWKLQQQGYRDINIRDARGRIYVVVASGRRGMPVRLIVDSRNGQVLERQRIRGW